MNISEIKSAEKIGTLRNSDHGKIFSTAYQCDGGEIFGKEGEGIPYILLVSDGEIRERQSKGSARANQIVQEHCFA